jgi:hypothetical protein
VPVNGTELLKICNYDHLLVAILITGQDNWEEILDSMPSPDLRANVASYVKRIRAALGHEL